MTRLALARRGDDGCGRRGDLVRLGAARCDLVRLGAAWCGPGIGASVASGSFGEPAAQPGVPRSRGEWVTNQGAGQVMGISDFEPGARTPRRTRCKGRGILHDRKHAITWAHLSRSLGGLSFCLCPHGRTAIKIAIVNAKCAVVLRIFCCDRDLGVQVGTMNGEPGAGDGYRAGRGGDRMGRRAGWRVALYLLILDTRSRIGDADTWPTPWGAFLRSGQPWRNSFLV